MSKSNDKKISCFSCHGPSACASGYKITGLPDNQNINYPDKSNLAESVTLLTDSTGKKLTSTLIPKKKCLKGKTDCPKTKIVKKHHKEQEEVVTELSPAKLSDTYTVSYDGTKFLKDLGPWEWLELAFKTDPSDVQPQTYISTTADCIGDVQETTINVFPALAFSGDLSIGMTLDAASVSKVKRRYEYTKEEAIELQKAADKEKWSQIGSHICEKEYEVNFKGAVSVGHEKKESSFKPFKKKATHFTNKNSPVHKLSRIMKNLGEKAMSNDGSGVIKKLTLVPPKLVISGKKELKLYDDILCYDYEYSLKVAPLVGAVVIVDVIDVLLSLLASPGAGMAWRKLRDRLEEMKNATEDDQKKYGWYGVFYIDFVLSGNVLQGEGTLSSTRHDKSFKGKAGSELGLQIKAGVEAGAQVLWVKGQMLAEADTSSTIRSDLVSDSKGVGVQFGHEGIRSHFTFTFKAEKINAAQGASTPTPRHNRKAVKNASSYELLHADVVWVEKDHFGPYYFIDS